MVPTSDPVATSDPGAPAEAGSTRKLLLDEMLAERERPPLPPAPVLSIDPAPVDAAPSGGLLGARKRLIEVEALARRNLRAAEEARRVVHEERQLLEEEASARTKAERTAAGLRREIERLRSTEEQRAAQARFAAAHEARSELASEIERVHDEHARVVDELDRMRGTLFDHDSLLDEYSRRLREEQEAQSRAHGDQVRAEEAQRVAERNLEIATETARRRAEEDLARFTKVEEAWRDACLERDRVTTELRRITTGDGELARLRVEIDSTREDMTRLLADLDVQAARADTAESELATTREACATAEKLAAEATEARDLSGIALETTRSELAERTEALDAERSTAQARIADLVAQLATATRTAESATERSADLESRLDGAIAARDEAVSRADAADEQMMRARSDAEQLRTQAASIGDELAATQTALEKSQATLHKTQAALEESHVTLQKSQVALDETRDEARRAAAAASTIAAAASTIAPTPPEVAPDRDAGPTQTSAGPAESVEPVADASAPAPAPAPAPSQFDAAFASAFGQEPAEFRASPEVTPVAKAKPKRITKFRTAAPDPNVVPVRAGGPEIELEASLARGILPVPDETPVTEDSEPAGAETAEAPPERSAETQVWRRTAMAELTALASDSDDLTPRRRR